jgi:hypothetical protein
MGYRAQRRLPGRRNYRTSLGSIGHLGDFRWKGLCPVIPQDFLTFFAASLTADGALIGLLFVAIAIEPTQTFGESADPERELAANGAFIGLVNAFLISMLALIPNVKIGWAVVVIAGLSLLNTVVHASVKLRRGAQRYTRSLVYTIGGLLVYGLEILYSIQLIQRPDSKDALYSLIFVLVAEYGVALARAWTLLGAERRSLFRLAADALRKRLSGSAATAHTSGEKKPLPPA